MWEVRPAHREDREAVLALLAERDLADFGEEDFTRSLVLDHWRGRDFADSKDSVVVEDAGVVVAYAAVFAPGTLAFVHPGREGQGIGSELLRWTEERARDRDTLRQRVAAGDTGARALLESAGYHCARSVHCLTIAAQSAPAPVAPPPGTRLDPVDLPGDAREIFEADRRGFAQSPDYNPVPFETFCDEHLSSPELHGASSAVARADRRAVGFVLCRKFDQLGYIDLLAVDPAARGQGLGTALLVNAIDRLVADGVREVRLDVASDNPTAWRLYGRAGMTPCHEVQVFEKPGPRTGRS